MNISDAINTIESIAGVTDESTPAGEAWAAILRYIRSTPVAQPVPVSEWRTIDTALKDGTEIMASDYDAVEILSWHKGNGDRGIPGEWINRDGEAFYPAWWQPLPDYPALPPSESDFDA